MSCPYFKEGYFGICVAPEAIHVPAIAEMETFCFKEYYEACPSYSGTEKIQDAEMTSRSDQETSPLRQIRANLHFAW